MGLNDRPVSNVLRSQSLIFSTVACNATPARLLWYVNYITPLPRNVSLGRLWQAAQNVIKSILLTATRHVLMVGHLFQNYDTIYVRFFPTYTCNHSCYTIYVCFFVTYTCVLFPTIWLFSYKRAYICAQKSPYICVTNKHVVYGVTESRRIRGTELYRWQKALHVRRSWIVTSVWVNHGRNGRVNFEQDLVLYSLPSR